MGRLIDLTGKKFGRLTVIGRSPVAGKNPKWDCICECGNEVRVRGDHMKAGNTTSCGCFRREKTSDAKTIHAKSGTYQYEAWNGIKTRCYNENCRRYKDYGGRGIKIYYRWKDDAKAFCEWLDRFLGPRPEGYTLDRINNDGDYEPRNLRWADAKTQMNNQRRSK